jgi:hypothetical protein
MNMFMFIPTRNVGIQTTDAGESSRRKSTMCLKLLLLFDWRLTEEDDIRSHACDLFSGGLHLESKAGHSFGRFLRI